ncbi:hypothetical protein P691DRAFT_811265 [Macrolepiota fuliginosa MF-IS2]|uniref:C-CAP/cofactor C-like domain-containing protein n=1 Tax=Macrolepiota fuliginosa MF-IS2 TaxID=1400762 RepID=A0A9P6C668_9AGAR|nr:hypothetical protein P691DRAFT_811265 [Macrolepiota fuliginosa MF-IS2]
MENDNTIWTFSQNFTTEFRSARSELEARLDAAKTSASPQTLQSLSVDLAKLAKSLTDAAGSLPTYDQKLYETQVNTLEKSLNDLRTSTTPKPKFSFKRKAPNTPLSTPPAQSAMSTSVQTTSSPSSSNSFISAHTYTYLTIDSLTGPPPTSDLTVSDLDHCVLNLLPTVGQSQLDISSIHIRGITDSLLLLPMINGSVLIHDLSRCVIVIGCHQFRMHTSTKVDAFLSLSSNPVIEDCHDVRFAPYPALLRPEQPGAESVSNEYPRGEFRADESIKTFLVVQDFSHIRNTPSPNWIHMDQPDMNRPWPEKPLTSRSEIEAMLQIILPQ